MGCPARVNTNSGCSPRQPSITDLATRFKTTYRSRPFFPSCVIERPACGEAVKNGVSVQTQLAEALPLIQGDGVQLQQVILNLILNAIQAMSGVGEGLRELLISTARGSSGDVLVAVQDSGPGLDPASLERVFEAFYTTKPGGLGIGLSICRSIIETHGGRLWASADMPRGATFQFTLPVP
jgi:signal transduction histidine kinase